MTSKDSNLAMPRETGSAKAKVECPECGGKVPLVESEYGSVSTGACPKCWPKATKADSESQLEAQEAAAAEAAK